MHDYLTKAAICAVLLLMWEIIARLIDVPLLLPPFLDVAKAFIQAMDSNDPVLIGFVKETSKSLFLGFGVGSLVATFLTILAINSRIGEQFLSTVTGAMAPLPAVAVFPISLMLFGITVKSLVFIAAFASVFPLAVAMIQGFRGVPVTLRSVGRNVGLSSLGLTCRILIPAALPSILSGLRSGFSNAFRALVAVEMVIGAASGSGGLGWMVMSAKQDLNIPLVYAGILAIMIIGLSFEGVFRLIESVTVKKWGMSS